MCLWVWGWRLDRAVRQYVWERYHVRLRRRDATAVRKRIGTAYPPVHETATVVGGVILTSEEVRAVYRRQLYPLLDRILKQKPRRVRVCGARLAGIDLLIRDECSVDWCIPRIDL